MMNFTLRLLVLFLVTAIALPSCVSKKKFTELEDQNAQLASQLSESQQQVATLEENVSNLESEMQSEKDRLNSEIAGIKSDLDATKSQNAQLQEKFNMTEAELAKAKKAVRDAFGLDSGVEIAARDGELYVVMADPVNYRSGSSRLNRAARQAVEELAETLKANPQMKVIVEGHTDNKQFVSGSGMDNWQLSVNRAMNVVKRLIRKGVNPDQLTVAGAGDTDPAASNDTNEGRSENRRTVVKPNPNIGVLLEVGGN